MKRTVMTTVVAALVGAAILAFSPTEATAGIAWNGVRNATDGIAWNGARLAPSGIAWNGTRHSTDGIAWNGLRNRDLPEGWRIKDLATQHLLRLLGRLMARH